MSRKKRLKKTYTYKCSLSGIPYKTHREAKRPDELLSVDAYYDLHPEEDKRPESEKIKRKQAYEERKVRLGLDDETMLSDSSDENNEVE